MKRLLSVSQKIDAINESIGKSMYWLTLAAVLVGAFNALVRYLDRFTGWGLSSNTYIEAQWYLFGIFFLMSAAYTLRHNEHVRVDVLYGKLSEKGRAWIDVLGAILFLIPFCVLMIAVCIPAVSNSWAVLEMSPDPGGLPRYPIKTIIPVAFFFLLLQGISQLIKSTAVLTGTTPGSDIDG